MSAGPYQLIFDGDPTKYDVFFDVSQLPRTTEAPNVHAFAVPVFLIPEGPNAGIMSHGPRNYYADGNRLYVCVTDDGEYLA